MTELPALKQLTDEAKDSLILALWEALQKLQEKQPQKPAQNSSLPPAKGCKAEVKREAKGRGQNRAGSLGRAGGGRPLRENRDPILEASVKIGQACGAELGASRQQLMEREDKLDLPPLAAIVTSVERSGGRSVVALSGVRAKLQQDR